MKRPKIDFTGLLAEAHKQNLRMHGLPDDFNVGDWLRLNGGLHFDKNFKPIMSKKLRKASIDLDLKYPNFNQ